MKTEVRRVSADQERPQFSLNVLTGERDPVETAPVEMDLLEQDEPVFPGARTRLERVNLDHRGVAEKHVRANERDSGADDLAVLEGHTLDAVHPVRVGCREIGEPPSSANHPQPIACHTPQRRTARSARCTPALPASGIPKGRNPARDESASW